MPFLDRIIGNSLTIKYIKKMRIQEQIELGFTLLEMLVTLVIVGILVTMAVPSIHEFLRNNQLSSRTDKLISTFNFTRSEAITQNGLIYITAIAVDNWGEGWTIWVDQDGDGLLDNGLNDTEILHEVRFSGATTIKLQNDDFSAISLEAISLAQVDSSLKPKTLGYRGNAALAVTSPVQFNICDDRSNEKGRQIEIRITGRVAMVNNDDFQCQ
ncbi:MAG: hypothetical protein DRQ49_16385 [Gammaproteobacteria bacterium]|nr:MAG: hypothetical protein DRQ49_16385 [Gammaproteobacteria bacterium]RKZ38243.1 MAG: hypothetical protein DRQ41_12370 [Gammaproteobacteria bacterium]RKZ74793.1 MAG: hypothetical protein DRQ57_09705 [Gammaproteobacteria bacterium]